MTTGKDPVRDDDAERPPTDAAAPGDAPRAPGGPAPIIDLDGDAVPVRPVKPLGPRRLARLQRELAERSRELAGTGADPADPALLEKQRRFAELAARAAAGNVPATGADEEGEQGAGGVQAAPQDPGPEVAPERITVVFPDAPGALGDPELHDPVRADPALFGHRLAPEELAALTHIEVLPAHDAEPSGSHAVAPEAAAPEAAAPDIAAPEAAAADISAVDIAAPDAAAPEVPAPPRPAPPPPASTAPDEAEPAPPAAPVPAAAAEGLELLEPREYRRRPVNRWLAVLLAAVLAALVVVLVLFVL